MRRALLGLEFLSVLTIVMFLLSSASTIAPSGGAGGGGALGQRYSCTNGQCVADSGGPYSNLLTCQASCSSGGGPSGSTTTCADAAPLCPDGSRASSSGSPPNCVYVSCSCGNGICEAGEQQLQCQNGQCNTGACPLDCGCANVKTCTTPALGTYTVSTPGTYQGGTCFGDQPTCNLCVQNQVTCEPKTCTLGGGSCVRLCDQNSGQCGDCDLTCPDIEPASTTTPEPITPSIFITTEEAYQYVPATTVTVTEQGNALEITEPVTGTVTINTPVSELTISPVTEDVHVSIATDKPTTPGKVVIETLTDEETTSIKTVTGGNPIYTSFKIENTKLEDHFQSGSVEIAVSRDFVDSLINADPNTAVRFSVVETQADGTPKLVTVPDFHLTHDDPKNYYYRVTLPHLSTFVIDARTTFSGPKSCNFDNKCDLAESAATCSDCAAPQEQLCTSDACFGNDLYACSSGHYLKKTTCPFGCAGSQCATESTAAIPSTVLSLLVIITVISAGIVGFIFLR